MFRLLITALEISITSLVLALFLPTIKRICRQWTRVRRRRYRAETLSSPRATCFYGQVYLESYHQAL